MSITAFRKLTIFDDVYVYYSSQKLMVSILLSMAKKRTNTLLTHEIRRDDWVVNLSREGYGNFFDSDWILKRFSKG